MNLPPASNGFSQYAIAVLVVMHATGGAVADTTWSQFRGANSSGIATGPAPPIEFGSGKHELWRVPCKSGHSSPCIVNESIFLTTFDDASKQLAVTRHNRQDGKLLWEYIVKSEAIETGHPSFNPASSTPAADTECVVTYFGSFGLVCLDHSGELIWQKTLPLARSYGGNAISPIIVGDKVILYRGNHTDHYLTALNKQTGETIWKTKQPDRFSQSMSCTGTPVIHGNHILLHGVNSVQAFNLEDGERVWRVQAATTATSTPVIAGNELVVATWHQTGEPDLTPVPPSFETLIAEHDENKDNKLTKAELPRLMVFHRSEGTDAPSNGMPLFFAWVDGNKDGEVDEAEWNKYLKRAEASRASFVEHGILAIPLDSEGLVPSDQIRNLSKRAVPEVPSPLYYEGLIYFVKNGGILTCIDLKSGEQVYRKRTGGKATHYASPVIAGDALYCTAGNGDISVIRAGRDFELLATNRIEERVYATPAIVDGKIYVRTHHHLIAFGK